MAKSKIVQFPNRVIKSIKDNLSSEKKVKEDRVQIVSFDMNDRETQAYLFPVKMYYESRYDTYYILTRLGDITTSVDCSKHIRIPKDSLEDTEKWVYPTENSVATKMEIDNYRLISEKYLFLPIKHEHFYRKETNLDKKKRFLTTLRNIGSQVNIRLENGDNLLLSDKPNAYGLIEFTDDGKLLAKHGHFVHGVSKKRIQMQKDILVSLVPRGSTRYFARVKLDNGIEYNRAETGFVRHQKYLYRELVEYEG
ncbi:MAG: hypothetical protein JEZ08_16530 [Clostridiales bacterium]|nr:hypothetical protein [Clostridiales bacterium]